MGIGQKIRIHRLLKNYSQEYMSWELEISQAAYSKIERDETEISVRRIYQIAEVLEISPFELMPKPKYGININPAFFYRLISRITGFFRRGFAPKSPAPFKYLTEDRDKSNSIAH